MTQFLYCTRCVMPNTRPHLAFDAEGVCGACRSFEARKTIDWSARRTEFTSLLERYRSRGGNYDCIVPVSGGKDSFYQTKKMLDFGMRPLCVNGATDSLSAVGRRNLDTLRRLGVDMIEVSFNPTVRQKINRLALIQVGDISWPEHIAIFTTPIRVAVQMNIPLIIWGENSQNEYGGPASEKEKNHLDSNWLQEFGGLLGLRPSDLIGQDDISEGDLIPYTYPSDEDIRRVGVTGLYLGYYLPWDGLRNALLAQMHGFETWPTAIEGQLVGYENLDNHQTGIHDYFCYLKYGFGRATAQACLLIRRGLITRTEAMEAVRRHDGKFPWSYLGKPLEEILRDLHMTTDQFIAICDDFTNRQIFRTNNRGELIKDTGGNLIKVADDNPGERQDSA